MKKTQEWVKEDRLLKALLDDSALEEVTGGITVKGVGRGAIKTVTTAVGMVVGTVLGAFAVAIPIGWVGYFSTIGIIKICSGCTATDNEKTDGAGIVAPVGFVVGGPIGIYYGGRLGLRYGNYICKKWGLNEE